MGRRAPRLPQALAAAAAAAWAGGRLRAAQELAIQGVAAAGAGSPRAARAVNQLANLAMFDGRTGEATGFFGRAAALHRAAGEDVSALLCEISISQALAYGGGSEQAAARLGDLLDSARRTGNPSALSWAYFVTAEAAADLDVGRALAAYSASIEHAAIVDNRLFGMLARSSSIALSARDGPPTDALDEFGQVMEQWEDLGNEAAHWGALLHLVVLLVRVGSERDGALLAGAVRAARDRRPTLSRDERSLEDAVRAIRDRLGATATDETLREGAAMPLPAAVAHARRAIRTARQIAVHTL